MMQSDGHDRDHDAPAVVHFLEPEFEAEPFETLVDAVRFVRYRLPPERRKKVWIGTQSTRIDMAELATLAAQLGIEWDVDL